MPITENPFNCRSANDSWKYDLQVFRNRKSHRIERFVRSESPRWTGNTQTTGEQKIPFFFPKINCEGWESYSAKREAWGRKKASIYIGQYQLVFLLTRHDHAFLFFDYLDGPTDGVDLVVVWKCVTSSRKLLIRALATSPTFPASARFAHANALVNLSVMTFTLRRLTGHRSLRQYARGLKSV